MTRADAPLGRIPAATESVEQQALFRWAAYSQARYPELRWMFHIPNEGKRSMIRGAQMRQEGMKKGVPDVCLPVARGGYGALFIEMKRTRGGQMTPEQVQWAEGLRAMGNRVERCNGWEEAVKVIEDYLRGGSK